MFYSDDADSECENSRLPTNPTEIEIMAHFGGMNSVGRRVNS